MRPKVKKAFKKVKRVDNFEGRLNFLRLDKNERVGPLSELFMEKYKEKLNADILSAYPEVEGLRCKVSGYAGVSKDHIFLTHGSDAAIKQVFDVFAREGSSVVSLDPTYAMYAVYTKMAGANLKRVKCDKYFIVDKDKLLRSIAKGVSIVCIANPNSPTGTEFRAEFLLKCLKKCQKTGSLLLIDEAYYHFSETTMMPYISKEDNLVITRTFSKVFGLAGCRAGFIAGSSNLVGDIRKARPMYEVNALTALAMEVCLENMDEVKGYTKRVAEGKRYLIMACRGLGLITYPTHANFMNIKLPDKVNTGQLEDFGRGKGVLFKGKLKHPCFRNFIRVTLGPKKYMTGFIEVLEAFMKDR